MGSNALVEGMSACGLCRILRSSRTAARRVFAPGHRFARGIRAPVGIGEIWFGG